MFFWFLIRCSPVWQKASEASEADGMQVCGRWFRIGLLLTMRIMLHAPTCVMTFDVTFSSRKPPTSGARVGANDRPEKMEGRRVSPLVDGR